MKIKEYMKERGIRQAFLQRVLGISSSSCSAMLNGKRGISVDEYFMICNVLNVPLDYFKPDSGQKEENSIF
ncbi:MAG: helix-turn-helix transcriptional regulator [Chitinispirillales bacterium]|nr:helix-turn-helix transcriptional regulator [Chitinispirillales bacterium]